MTRKLTAVFLVFFSVFAFANHEYELQYTEEGGSGRYELLFDRSGDIVRGSAVGDNRWNAVGGFRRDGNLVVMFQRENSSDCKGNLTHFYRIDTRVLLLDFILDKCGTLYKMNGKRHFIR